MFYGGSCRDFACSKKHDPKPIKWDELKVSKAITGVSIECKLGARGRRTKTVNLAYVAAPSNDDLAAISKSSLERLAGDTIRIPYQGILKRPVSDISQPMSSSVDEDLVEEDDDSGKVGKEPLESRVYVGLVYGMSGQCLNTEQVRLGMVKLLPEAPKDWKQYEDEAKNKNLGIWKKAGGRK